MPLHSAARTFTSITLLTLFTTQTAFDASPSRTVRSFAAAARETAWRTFTNSPIHTASELSHLH